MKVLVGHFSSESNEHSKSLMTFDKFLFKFGEDAIDALEVRDIFEDKGIELIPSIVARGHPHGPVTKDTFDFIYSRFMQAVKDHVHEIDGIYLFLHGASKVLELEGGSAEHAIVKGIRKLVGPHLPIAVTMDPHGNLSDELVDNVQILRCYRESPHIDATETKRFVARELVDLLSKREDIRPVYYRIPIIIGGERSVSFVEPVKSINALCDEAEKSDRIRSASYHIGYLRHDGDKLGNGVVVVPKTKKDTEYAREWALKIRDYVYSRRDDFEFYGNVAEPDEALRQVVEHEGSPTFIQDSGDNVGSGADGFNTYILRKILNLDDFHNKEYLVSAIVDQEAHKYLKSKEVGDAVEFDLGKDHDYLSKKVHVKGKLVAKGLGSEAYRDKTDIGAVYTVKFDDYPVSVIVEFDAIQYLMPEQYEESGLNMEDYDVFVVKQGYISEEFRTIAPHYCMALTQGPTYQRSELLEFKRIQRPMWPYDEFEIDEI